MDKHTTNKWIGTSDWKEYSIRDLLFLEYWKSLTDYRSGNGEYDVFGTNGKIGLTYNYLYNEPFLVIERKGPMLS